MKEEIIEVIEITIDMKKVIKFPLSAIIDFDARKSFLYTIENMQMQAPREKLETKQMMSIGLVTDLPSTIDTAQNPVILNNLNILEAIVIVVVRNIFEEGKLLWNWAKSNNYQ